jgi:hypothetical protein
LAQFSLPSVFFRNRLDLSLEVLAIRQAEVLKRKRQGLLLSRLDPEDGGRGCNDCLPQNASDFLTSGRKLLA